MGQVRESEAEALQSRELLEAVLDYAPGFIIAIDEHGKLQFINRVLPQHDKKSVIGSDWLQYVPPEQRDAVLKVKDPTTAACTVEYWAGTRTPKPEFSPSNPPNAGDVDGPGATAKLSTPGPIVTDDAGNAYVYDSDSRKIKKIANDAAHTVSTLGGKKIDVPYTIRNMTRIGSKLYAIGDDSSKATVIEVDTTSGAVRTVLEGRSDAFPPLPSSRGATIHGITTDGKGLILSGLGSVWYLTTAGKLSVLAGDGTSFIDFPKTGYDPKASQPAAKLQLPGTRAAPGPNQEVGSFEFITFHKGAIYTRGSKGPGYFVEKISCP